jgi:hypothetical protein
VINDKIKHSFEKIRLNKSKLSQKKNIFDIKIEKERKLKIKMNETEKVN